MSLRDVGSGSDPENLRSSILGLLQLQEQTSQRTFDQVAFGPNGHQDGSGRQFLENSTLGLDREPQRHEPACQRDRRECREHVADAEVAHDPAN